MKSPLPKKSAPASPLVSSAKKQRPRSYFSMLINLSVLIALFTFVFALQHIGTKSSDQTTPQPTSTEISTEKPSTPLQMAKKSDDREKKEPETVKTAVVDLPRTFAPKQPARTYRRSRGIGWEDRQQSARLVEQLDGGYRCTHGQPTYTPATTPPPQPYATHDLDNDAARQSYLRTNQASSSEPLAMTSTQSSPPERSTTYVTGNSYSKPAWEVTTGN